MEEQTIDGQTPAAPPQEESIFSESDFSPEGYDKHVRDARNAIFAVAAIQFVFGIYIGFSGPENTRLISVSTTTVISLIFLGLGFWTRKKPYYAILAALIIYVVLLATDAIYDPTTLYKGILMKAAIIFTLVKSLGKARDAQRWKKALGQE